MKSLLRYHNASIIIDNNVLIDLYELGLLHIIFKVFNKVGIPKIVIEKELDTKIVLLLEEYEYELVIIDTIEGFNMYNELTKNKFYKRLSEIDKITISIANQYDFYCCSNDGLIRKACAEFNIKNIGTLGILGCAFAIGLIGKTKFINYLGMLSSDKTSCFIKEEIINQFLNEINIKIK